MQLKKNQQVHGTAHAIRKDILQADVKIMGKNVRSVPFFGRIRTQFFYRVNGLLESFYFSVRCLFDLHQLLLDVICIFSSFSAWIGSLPLAVSFFFGPFASSLINHFGCRAMSITGCLTCAISFTIASFANDLILLYVTFGVLGAGASCAFISSLEIVSKCFDKRKSIALGIVATGHGLGTMSLSQVLQSLVNVLSWRNSLRIMAGALVLNGLLGLLYDSKIEPASNGEILSSEEDGQRRKSKRRFTFNCSVWKVPRFLVLTACGFFAMFGRSIVYVHLVSSSQYVFSIGNSVPQTPNR